MIDAEILVAQVRAKQAREEDDMPAELVMGGGSGKRRRQEDGEDDGPEDEFYEQAAVAAQRKKAARKDKCALRPRSMLLVCPSDSTMHAAGPCMHAGP